jgi:hypothetical protein
MTTRKTALLVSVLFLSAGSTASADITPYSDPLQLGDYVQDLNGMLERAFSYDGWQLRSHPDPDTYVAFLSYKERDISVHILVRDQNLTLSVESVFETGCASPCEDLGEESVSKWIVNLRRSIAVELTTLVRDGLQSQM